MTLTHIEHIGIAVKNLDRAVRYYEDVLGLKCYGTEEVRDQQVKTAFFRIGQTKIELLETTDPGGPIGKFIAQRGEGLHHIAFAVPDVAAALKEAAARGVQLVDTAPRPGAEGMATAFLHPHSTGGVLTELCGKK